MIHFAKCSKWVCPVRGFIMYFTADSSVRNASIVLYFCRYGAHLRACCTASWLGWFLPPSRTKLYALMNRCTGSRMMASLNTFGPLCVKLDDALCPFAMMRTFMPDFVYSVHPSLLMDLSPVSLRASVCLIADPAVLGTCTK